MKTNTLRSSRSPVNFSGLVLIVLAIGATGHLAGRPARACPMCSESLPDNTQPTVPQASSQANGAAVNSGGSLAKGFYYSILLMLAVPFSLMGGLGGMLYWAVRRSDKHARPTPDRLTDPPLGP